MKPHTPFAHRGHKDGTPCGCYTKDDFDSPTVWICPHCGAAYDYHETITFPVWQCHDCGRMYVWNSDLIDCEDEMARRF